MRLLDTNVLIRRLTQDDPGQSPRASALLTKIENGQEHVLMSPMTVFETVSLFSHATVSSARRYDMP